MEGKIGPLCKCHTNMETQMVKLAAWIQTFGFILEGLDKDGAKARKSDTHAVVFADHYPAYSEMLFLALSGLQECKDALEKLCEKESGLIKVTD